MKVVINDNQKGLLFKNGVLTGLLEAGKYGVNKVKTIETINIVDEIKSEKATLAKILDLSGVKEMISEITVKDGEIGLHYVDGIFAGVLESGRHAFWNEEGAHEFKIYNTAEPRINDIPKQVIEQIGANYVESFTLPANSHGVVYYNGKATEFLSEGTYYYWKGGVSVTHCRYDIHIQELRVNGQEILTKDKVGVRVNFSLNWKIVDYKKIAEEYGWIEDVLYTAAQLALRDYLGGKTMDELLSGRENLDAEVLEILRKRTEGMYIELISAGIRDVILPGEISAIMNNVLAAEKRAQANVITRREEVASTRSLLNTAKLMDENATLRRLKELEYIERICENVGEITVDARSSLLTAYGNSGKWGQGLNEDGFSRGTFHRRSKIRAMESASIADDCYFHWDYGSGTAYSYGSYVAAKPRCQANV